MLHDPITRLTIESPSGKVVLEQGEGSWKLASPGPYTADDFIVDSLLREIKSLRASDFIDDGAGKESKFGLDKPFITITAEPKEGPPAVIKFGKADVETKDGKKASHYFLMLNGKSTYFELAGDPTTHVVKVSTISAKSSSLSSQPISFKRPKS